MVSAAQPGRRVTVARHPRSLFPETSGGADGPVVGVLALQGDVREHGLHLGAVGARPVAVRSARDLEALDGLIIPGGESTVMEKLLASFGMREPLRRLVEDGLPVYGSCAGMILLADRIENPAPGQHGLGGLDVTVRRNAFGRQVDSYEEDLLAPALGADESHPLHAVFIRAPWIDDVGEGVEVLARTRSGRAGGADAATPSPTGSGRAVAVRQGRLLATSFHPEMDADHRVHAAFVQMVRDAAS